MSEIQALNHLIDNSALRDKLKTERLSDGRISNWNAVKSFSRSWSSGERTLLRVAENLWNGSNVKFNLRRDVIDVLDDKNFAAVLEAIRILRGVREPAW